MLRRVPRLTDRSLHRRAGALDAEDGDTAVGVQPAVYRGASPTLVDSDAATTTAIPLTTADVRLPMRAGDRLGVHATGPAVCRGRT